MVSVYAAERHSVYGISFVCLHFIPGKVSFDSKLLLLVTISIDFLYASSIQVHAACVQYCW